MLPLSSEPPGESRLRFFSPAAGWLWQGTAKEGAIFQPLYRTPALVRIHRVVKGHVVSAEVGSEVVILLLIQASHCSSIVALHHAQFQHAQSFPHASLLRQGYAFRQMLVLRVALGRTGAGFSEA